MSTDTLEKTTTTTEAGEHDLFAHFAKKTDIERAVFDGVAITALCGKTWRPTRDFAKFPVCPTCAEIYGCNACMVNAGNPRCAAHEGLVL
ncbi:hypothetical protein GCM10009775_04510 [Microbacterium aoyamense]|uniref:DUF3039 domain-containing protein n=1 Tax=Microbacterium aoyamense TaxID=344166 RepID=A0ABP5APC6_9MICO|nr:DUF3039 domain-containing protein [Microbacterium aoyamense]